MSAPVRIGVVGAGALGYHHVRLLREVDGATLVGFHDSRPDRAHQVAGELGVRAFESVEALVEACDALTIAVPTPAHYAVAKPALERGRHLLIEKPIAASLAEADELLAIATRTGALIQTGHVERFNRAVRAALPYVDAPRFIDSDRLAPSAATGRARGAIRDHAHPTFAEANCRIARPPPEKPCDRCQRMRSPRGPAVVRRVRRPPPGGGS